MPLHLRPARPADVPALQALARRTITASYTPFLGAKTVAAFLDSGASDQYIVDRLPHVAVLLDDDGPVGLSVCRGAEVELMMVDAGRHRRGLGTRLLRHCEQQLFAEHDEICLESFEPNDQANDFYRKHGWQAQGVAFDPESGVNKIRFVKRA